MNNVQMFSGCGVKKVGGVLKQHNLMPSELQIVGGMPAAMLQRAKAWDFVQGPVEAANPGTVARLTTHDRVSEGINYMLMASAGGDKIELLSIPEIEALSGAGLDEAAMVEQLQA